MDAQVQLRGPQTLRLALWWMGIAVWTVGLLTPQPVWVLHETVPAEAGYPLSKGLHVFAYAVLAAAVPWLGLTGSRRWWLVALLSLHAFATEWGQTWVPERTGSLTDVGIDHVGILLGVVSTWWAWRSPPG